MVLKYVCLICVLPVFFPFVPIGLFVPYPAKCFNTIKIVAKNVFVLCYHAMLMRRHSLAQVWCFCFWWEFCCDCVWIQEEERLKFHMSLNLRARPACFSHELSLRNIQNMRRINDSVLGQVIRLCSVSIVVIMIFIIIVIIFYYSWLCNVWMTGLLKDNYWRTFCNCCALLLDYFNKDYCCVMLIDDSKQLSWCMQANWWFILQAVTISFVWQLTTAENVLPTSY